MKNFRLVVAICAALMIAAPAMALEVEVSGHYFVDTYNHSNQTLNKDEASNDYASMEFMAKPVFKVNDNITLTTQFTALQDHVWGTDASGQYESDNPLAPKMDNTENLDWKAAYMTIKTPIGGFILGRYIDTPWGTGLGDVTAAISGLAVFGNGHGLSPGNPAPAVVADWRSPGVLEWSRWVRSS